MANPIIVPRRREDWFDEDGNLTLRALRFLEGLTDTSNETVFIVESTEQGLTSTSSRVSRNEAVIKSLQLKQFEIVNTTVSLTTEDFQIIICKNTAPITITLDPQALQDDEVHIKRRDKKVTVVGSIDGLTNKLINVKNYSMHLVFDGTDWSEI